MKKQLFAFTAALGVMSILTAVPAFAMIRNLEINADLDNITEPSEHGVCFYPDYEVEEDEDVSVVFGTPQVINNGNPMYPATIPVVIHSDNEALDDDLKISGTGIRSTYIDSVSVDNAEASGRLQVYPLYILMDANPVLNTAAGTASWNSVPYAGKYEVLISYPKKNGETQLVHKTTKETSLNISGYQKSSADGQVGIAVRAIASDAMAAQDAVIGTDGIARWDNLKAYTDGYKVQISYVDNANKKAKTSTKTTNNYLDVTGYINSAKPGTLKVEVKTMPDYNDSRFYNIANGDWKQTGYPVDTTDYEEDRWDFLSDYKAVNDGNFAQNLNSAGSANYYRGALATSADGSWNRVTYKWQFLVNGVPYNQGWKKINGYWYYFDPDGFMHTGWLNANGKWYYLESQVGAACGIMYTGVHQINGQNYQFDANGVCLNR